mmetsp:Transcript_12398/g.36852  ORF Transcript_12398/g.36852 Transcript_12398/m.36852 type:complete len:254 (-) Transcript_12398:1209-1970(-)
MATPFMKPHCRWTWYPFSSRLQSNRGVRSKSAAQASSSKNLFGYVAAAEVIWPESAGWSHSSVPPVRASSSSVSWTISEMVASSLKTTLPWAFASAQTCVMLGETIMSPSASAARHSSADRRSSPLVSAARRAAEMASRARFGSSSRVGRGQPTWSTRTPSETEGVTWGHVARSQNSPVQPGAHAHWSCEERASWFGSQPPRSYEGPPARGQIDTAATLSQRVCPKRSSKVPVYLPESRSFASAAALAFGYVT